MSTKEFLIIYICGAFYTWIPTKNWREHVIIVLACLLWPLWWLGVLVAMLTEYVKGK